jgi:hypothetical protein
MAWGVSRRPREWAQLGGRSPGLRLIAVFFFLLWKRNVILAGLRQGQASLREVRKRTLDIAFLRQDWDAREGGRKTQTAATSRLPARGA